jgi:16S rRNA (adenine1518-N6/adenine1519-N6)-dimethyltransferase
VPPNAFWPRPEVRSAIVRLRRRAKRAVAGVDDAAFFALVKTAFGQRRKQIRNSLGGPPLSLERGRVDLMLATAGIDGRRRAEDLTLAEFGSLARLAAGLPGQPGDDVPAGR